jgi:diguanylate cyclase (GGDEF)-like protein
VLYLFCYKLPDSLLEPGPFAKAIANSYALLPFVVLACVGLFPLTVLESMSIVAFLLTTYFVANAHSILALWSPDLGAAWIMTLLAAITVVVSHSQLRLLMRLIGYSSYDLLTNCLGRRSGEEVIKTLWHYSVRQKSHFSVVFIDLDHFKPVNDRFGHKEGDAVLASAAGVIRNAIRKSDLVIRWGGDEFLIVMPDARIEDATKVMTRMAEGGFGARPDGSRQKASIGIAERLNDVSDSEKTLIQTADERLYQAKTSGRCRAVGLEIVMLAST